jgi:hypothetical protein
MEEPEPEFVEEEPEPEPEGEEEAEPGTGPVDELLLGLEPEEPAAPAQRKSPARAAVAQKERQPGAPEKGPTGKMRVKMPSKKTVLIAGLVIAIIVVAVAAIALLPALGGYRETVSPAPAAPVTTVPAPTLTPVTVATPPATTLATPAAPMVAATPADGDVPGAEQALPPQYTLYFEVDKNAVTGDVTVTATGPSRNVVKDITVQLTRADGEVVTDHIIPSQGMTDVTLTGTQNPERVEVTVLFYSGEQYKVIDRIVTYSRWR